MTHTSFFHTRFIVRLMVILLVGMSILSFTAWGIATFIPKQLIVVDVVLRGSRTHKLAIVDAYTNKYILLDYPVDISSYNSSIYYTEISDNGRRAVIVYPLNIAIWDILTGQVIYISRLGICPDLFSEHPPGFIDYQNITFTCSSGLRYMFNFDTQQITSLPRGTERVGDREVSYTRQSNDNQKIASFNFEQGILEIKLVNEENFTKINPLGKIYHTFAWHPDSQSIFTLSNGSLERYYLETKSWETIVSNVETPLDYGYGKAILMTSPDAKWVTFINRDNNQAYNFNIDTKTQVNLGVASYDMQWSPDSQWLIIKRGNLSFVIRPDMSEIIPFQQERLYKFIWSPDSTKISYNFLSDTKQQSFIWDFETPQKLHLLYTEPYWFLIWSPDSKTVIFTTQSRQLIYMTETGEKYQLLNDNFEVHSFGFVR